MAIRKTSILTPKDREYLDDPSNFDKQQKYERRQSITQGVHQGLVDVSNLLEHYNPDDLLTEDYLDEPPTEEEITDLLSDHIAIILLLSEQADQSFQDLLLEGLTRATVKTPEGERTKETEISIKIHAQAHRLEAVLGKLNSGEDLMHEDYITILRELANKPERFEQVFKDDIHENIINKIKAGKKGYSLADIEKNRVMDQLKEYDTTELWEAVLVATGLSFTKEELHEFIEST